MNTRLKHSTMYIYLCDELSLYFNMGHFSTNIFENRFLGFLGFFWISHSIKEQSTGTCFIHGPHLLIKGGPCMKQVPVEPRIHLLNYAL